MKKTIALLCYLTWIGWLIAIIIFFSDEKYKDSYTRFHIRQSLGLGLTAIACYGVFLLFDSNLFYFSLPSLLAFMFLLVLWYWGFNTAMNEKEKPIPIIGKYFQRWLAFIK